MSGVAKLLLTLFLAPAIVHAALFHRNPLTPEKHKQGETRLGISASHYRSNSNFDSSGTSQSLQNNGQLFHSDAALSVEYGFREQLAFLASLGLGNTTVDTSIADPQKTSLEHFLVGARFVAPEPRVNLFVEGFLDFPLYSRLNAAEWARLDRSSEAPLGSGSALMGLSGVLEFPISASAVFGAKLGYTYRTQGFSSFLPYGSYVKLAEADSFFARAGVVGTLHATGDKYANNPTSTERAQTVIAGSNYANAIDLRYLAVDIAAGLSLSPKALLALGYQRELSGRSAPVGHHILAALTFRFRGEQEDAPHVSNTPEQRRASNQGFFQYSGGAKVIRVNNALRLILIDKGRNDGMKVGELLDVFGESANAVARARITEAGPTRSKLEVLEYFPTGKGAEGKPIPLREGFVVRRPLP